MQNDQVGVQSMEMLKVRAALEDKLKQKGVFSSIVPKPNKAKKHLKLVNGYCVELIPEFQLLFDIVMINSSYLDLNRQLETYDDFVDDAMDVEKGALKTSASKLSQLVTAQPNKPKV